LSATVPSIPCSAAIFFLARDHSGLAGWQRAGPHWHECARYLLLRRPQPLLRKLPGMRGTCRFDGIGIPLLQGRCMPQTELGAFMQADVGFGQ
jgi:hypothetical protein